MRASRDRSYLLLTLFTLVFAGGGLIALIYGPSALLTALPILLLGALFLLGLWLLVTAVSRWREQGDEAYHRAAREYLNAREDAPEQNETNRPGS